MFYYCLDRDVVALRHLWAFNRWWVTLSVNREYTVRVVVAYRV